jgi:NAD(P)-dependent dehydrogenase (short-subunit alcohol dehydrogenase family)
MGVWFITGAGRGMGLHIAKAALAAGHQVVATGRDTAKVAEAFVPSDNLLIVKLDVTKPDGARSAAQAALARFERIDVLVNNAASYSGGYFEELSPRQIDLQLATALIGPMNVTRAILPAMRQQRSGKIISISSAAGLVGMEFCTAYSAAKFGLDGWSEALHAEVAPFGIQTMIVNPGFFRTEFLTTDTTQFADLTVSDYAERRAGTEDFMKSMNGAQGGDPAKLAQALITLDREPALPRRFLAGADVVSVAEQKLVTLQAEIEAWRALSSSLAIDA